MSEGLTCTWLVEGWPEWANDPECEWYPDSPADLIRECGAPVTETERGWTCTAGHGHVSAEHRAREGWDYVDDDEAEAIKRGHYLPTFTPVRMDGGPL